MPFDPNAHIKAKRDQRSVEDKLKAIREASGDGWAGVDVDKEIAEMRGSHASPQLFAVEDALIEKHIISIISHPEEAVSLAYSLSSMVKQRNRRADERILELERRLCEGHG